MKTWTKGWVIIGAVLLYGCGDGIDGSIRAIEQAEQLPAGAVYIESGGEVAIEAERFSTSTAVGGQEWQIVTNAEASNGEGVQVPDLGTVGPSSAPNPELTYDISFAATGTYNVWVRGAALPGGLRGSSDSVHVGLDGVFTASDNIAGFPSTMDWKHTTLDGPVATVDVASAGVHTLSLKMREDGLTVDKLYLTTSSTTPTGMGPTASSITDDTFEESEGLLVMEGESYSLVAAGIANDWTDIADSNASNSNAVQVLPDIGSLGKVSEIATAPRLDFTASFSQTGTYRVWVRGRAGGTTRGSSDSCHVGIDGTLPSTSDTIWSFGTTYGWQSATPSGPPTIAVETTGTHTINVWMREDGFVLDKIVLALDSLSFTPSGFGPPESSSGATCIDGVLNGSETDTDCGGSCATCADGAHCLQDSDCTSGLCDPVLEECIPAESCTDGALNQDETGVDCGGLLCDPCDTGDAPFLEVDGVVSCEAENAAAIFDIGVDPTWSLGSTMAGASGGAYLQASPDLGYSFNVVSSQTPRVDFPVLFGQAGTYYVWVLGAAAGSTTGSSDSLHVGLNGVSVSSAARVTGFASTFSWRNITMDGTVAVLDVPSPGLYGVNVWMREDGFVFDKIVLSLGDPTRPTGQGPAESPREP